MGSLIARLRRVQREALGLNRRNQEFLLPLNPPRLIALVDHKVRAKEVLAGFGVPVPETFGHYVRQRDLPALAATMQQHADFVLKPVRGAGGEGVVVIAERAGGRLMTPNGTALRPGDLLAHAADIIAGAFSLSQSRDEALLEYRLVPEPSLAGYSPGGIADARVLLFRGVPVMAMLRLPTHASDGRANLHVGGVGVGIDLATGRAVHAICRNRSVREHPDTRQPLSDLQVPAWSELLRIAAGSYDAIPLGYFGIDIVVDAERGPAVLELNARPGLAIQLANRRGLRRPLEVLRRRSLEGLSASDRVALGVEIARMQESGA